LEVTEVLDIAREAIYVLLKVITPLMVVALSVGLIISLFQALTQIQEMTLSFVPKIIAIFFSLILFLPYMFSTLHSFWQNLAERIANIS